MILSYNAFHQTTTNKDGTRDYNTLKSLDKQHMSIQHYERCDLERMHV